MLKSLTAIKGYDPDMKIVLSNKNVLRNARLFWLRKPYSFTQSTSVVLYVQTRSYQYKSPLID